MGQEVKPQVVKKGQYTNLDLRSTFKEDGDFVKMTKGDFAEGLERTGTSKDGSSYKFYGCKVEIDGEEASFILYEQDHDRFAALDVGANFKMVVHKEPYVDKKGMDRIKRYYTFEAF